MISTRSVSSHSIKETKSSKRISWVADPVSKRGHSVPLEIQGRGLRKASSQGILLGCKKQNSSESIVTPMKQNLTRSKSDIQQSSLSLSRVTTVTQASNPSQLATSTTCQPHSNPSSTPSSLFGLFLAILLSFFFGESSQANLSQQPVELYLYLILVFMGIDTAVFLAFKIFTLS